MDITLGIFDFFILFMLLYWFAQHEIDVNLGEVLLLTTVIHLFSFLIGLGLGGNPWIITLVLFPIFTLLGLRLICSLGMSTALIITVIFTVIKAIFALLWVLVKAKLAEYISG